MAADMLTEPVQVPEHLQKRQKRIVVHRTLEECATCAENIRTLKKKNGRKWTSVREFKVDWKPSGETFYVVTHNKKSALALVAMSKNMDDFVEQIGGEGSVRRKATLDDVLKMLEEGSAEEQAKLREALARINGTGAKPAAPAAPQHTHAGKR
jgi:hypothetical protein